MKRTKEQQEEHDRNGYCHHEAVARHRKAVAECDVEWNSAVGPIGRKPHQKWNWWRKR